MREEVERFLRRLGYRLALRELQHPQRIRAGGSLSLQMKWQNVGSAPCYRPYRLAYRLTDKQGRSKTLVGLITVDKWMPGTVDVFTEAFLDEPPDLPDGEITDVADRVPVPSDMQAGTYSLALGVVGEQTLDPVVRLPIKVTPQEGWYPLSEIVVHH